jgi:hypothetical protein
MVSLWRDRLTLAAVLAAGSIVVQGQATPPPESQPTAPAAGQQDQAPKPADPSETQQTPGAGAPQSQAPQKQPPTTAPQKPATSAPDKQIEKRVTPAEAKELFRSVDEILHFASQDTKLSIKHEVKRRMTTRDVVEKYVVEKFNDDKDAKRMQRSEIVLKKFGLLDRDFQLRPFLVSLLTEQIAGYYDNKTKTVNLLDWIEPDSQKPVLAHELTHALQDQHVDLEKWENHTQDNVSRTVEEDNEHLATDEQDSARDAVLEGQAMAVFVDYGLKPSGKSVLNSPDMVESMKNAMQDSSDSPVMARAPLLLQESLLFPYREGLGFEQVLWKDQGTDGAFSGALDHPPASSYEILNPKAFEAGQKVPLLHMPDIHGILDEADYEPYDIGVMGALDVRILAELFGGPQAAAVMTGEWDGGLYYAAQSRKAKTPLEKASTASLGLLYLSQWKSHKDARIFAALYADELTKKYSGVSRVHNDDDEAGEQVYSTNEGPALIVVSGKQVFTSESFDLDTARKLELVLIGAQKSGDLQTAHNVVPHSGEAGRSGELSGSIVHFISGCGLMRSAIVH